MLWLSLHGTPDSHAGLFGVAYVIGHLTLLGLWYYLPEAQNIFPLVLVGFVIRIFFLFFFPANSDIFRYLWEGHIQIFGYNPLAMAPNSQALTEIRTEYWNKINHPHLASIYLPMSQVLFRIIATLSESVQMVKLTLIGFESLSLVFLLRMLHFLNLPRKHALLFFLNPLLLLYSSGQGHAEIIFVFFTIAAVSFSLQNQYALMFTTLGLAAMTNFKAWFLLPFFLSWKNVKKGWFFLPPLLLALPYLQEGISWLSVPLRFATKYQFNGFVHGIFSQLFPLKMASLASFVVFLVALILIWMFSANIVRTIALASFAFLLCTPTLHPWYLLMLTPWIVFYRSPVWIAWHLSIVALFPIYDHFERTGIWKTSPLGLGIEYSVMAIVGCIYFWLQRRILNSKSQLHSAHLPTLTVIIPVLNEYENLPANLDALKKNQYMPLPEIVVVDACSTDGTKEWAESTPGLIVLASERGRGIQIAKGVAHAKGEVILILHADSRLLPNALQTMALALQKNPQAVGGAFASQYNNSTFKFKVISILNNFRSFFLGISFGDQAQFFRSKKLATDYPPYFLMEDIELSMRIKERGMHLHLPLGVTNSTRRWQNRGYLGNGTKVVWLTLLYLLRRRVGLSNSDGSLYYKKYYS